MHHQGYAPLWIPSQDVCQGLQVLSLVTLALIFGARLMPPLKPYAGRIGIAATVLYIVGALGLLAWNMTMHPAATP